MDPSSGNQRRAQQGAEEQCGAAPPPGPGPSFGEAPTESQGGTRNRPAREEAEKAHRRKPMLHSSKMRNIRMADDQDRGESVGGHQQGIPAAVGNHGEQPKRHRQQNADWNGEGGFDENVLQREGGGPKHSPEIKPSVVHVGGVKIKIPGGALDRMVPEIGPMQIEERGADERHRTERGDRAKCGQTSSANLDQDPDRSSNEHQSQRGRRAQNGEAVSEGATAAGDPENEKENRSCSP